MASFEETVQRIAQRFKSEFAKPVEIALPQGTLASHLQDLAKESGLIVRGSSGIKSPADYDHINTFVVDLHHPTSHAEGFDARLARQEQMLAQQGIDIDRRTLLELSKEDPYATNYARFFRKLCSEGHFATASDAVMLEGFDGKVAALARSPDLPIGVALAYMRTGQPHFATFANPFLQEVFDQVLKPVPHLTRTQIGQELSFVLDAAYKHYNPGESAPHGQVEGGSLRYSLYGVDPKAAYDPLRELMSRLPSLELQNPEEARLVDTLAHTLGVQRAWGIISDVGRLASGHRNIFTLYGKFDVMAWEEKLPGLDKNPLEQHIGDRHALIFSPQRIYGKREADALTLFMSQAKARQAEAQLERP